MPRAVSGQRIARSVVTPAGAATVEREIDFQLGPRLGIEIFQILGGMTVIDISETTDTLQLNAVQTLHLEAGSLETVPVAAAEDEDTIDSEIFFRQDLTVLIQEEAGTRGGSHSSMLVTPNAPLIMTPTLFSARNITHRGQNVQAALNSCLSWSHIYFRYVEFSLSELGLILARRT